MRDQVNRAGSPGRKSNTDQAGHRQSSTDQRAITETPQAESDGNRPGLAETIDSIDKADRSTRSQMLIQLQQSHGNRYVQRLISQLQTRSTPSALSANKSAQRQMRNVQRAPAVPDATAPAPPAEIELSQLALMRADVDSIVDMLRDESVPAENQQRIAEIIDSWANRYSSDQPQTAGTPLLDKFLQLLKGRSYQHSSFWSVGITRYSMAYDDLWHLLEGDSLARFKAAVAKSQHEHTNGPASGESENFWRTLGKQEAMGLFAALGGVSQGAAGIVDAGAWAITKAMKVAGLPVADPISAAKWVQEQYKFSGDQMFGEEYSKGDKLVGGMNAAEIGSAGGNLIWALVSVQTGAAKAMTVFNIASALKGVNDAAENIAKMVAAKQTKGNFSAAELLTDPNFLVECSKLAVSVFGAVSAGSATNPNLAQAAAATMHRVGILLNIAQATSQFGQLIDIAMSNKSASEKTAASGQVVVALLNTGVSMLSPDKNMEYTELGGKQQPEVPVPPANGGNKGNGDNNPPKEPTVYDPNVYEHDPTSPSGLKHLGPAEVPIPDKPGSGHPDSGLEIVPTKPRSGLSESELFGDVDMPHPEGNRPLRPEQFLSLEETNKLIDDLLVEGPKTTPPDASALQAAIESVRAGKPTRAALEIILRQAVEDYRAYRRAEVSGFVGKEKALDYSGKPLLGSEQLRGCCGTGRDISVESLVSLLNNSPHPVTLQRFQAVDVFGVGNHSFSVVVYSDGTRYLVDPTFAQFLIPRADFGESAPPVSGARGTGDPQNFRGDLAEARFAETLLSQGFMPLDENAARLYAIALGVAPNDAPLISKEVFDDSRAVVVDQIGEAQGRKTSGRKSNDDILEHEEQVRDVEQMINWLDQRGDPHGLSPILDQFVKRINP